MVSNGGAYAQAIFLAYNQAVRSAYEPPSAKGGARAEDVGQDDGFSLPPPRKRLRLDGEAPSLQKASAVSKEGEVGMPTRSNVRGGLEETRTRVREKRASTLKITMQRPAWSQCARRRTAQK